MFGRGYVGAKTVCSVVALEAIAINLESYTRRVSGWLGISQVCVIHDQNNFC